MHSFFLSTFFLVAIVCGLVFVLGVWNFFFTAYLQRQLQYVVVTYCILFVICWSYISLYIHFLLEGLPFSATVITVKNAEDFLTFLLRMCIFFSFWYSLLFLCFYLYTGCVSSVTKSQNICLISTILLLVYYLSLSLCIVYIELYASSWQILIHFLNTFQNESVSNSVHKFAVQYDPEIDQAFSAFIRDCFDLSFSLIFWGLLYIFFLNGYCKRMWYTFHGTLLLLFFANFYYFFGAATLSFDVLFFTVILFIFEGSIFSLYFFSKLKLTKRYAFCASRHTDWSQPWTLQQHECFELLIIGLNKLLKNETPFVIRLMFDFYGL